MSKLKDGVKLLSDGEIGFAIKVKVHKASQKADREDKGRRAAK